MQLFSVISLFTLSLIIEREPLSWFTYTSSTTTKRHYTPETQSGAAENETQTIILSDQISERWPEACKVMSLSTHFLLRVDTG